MMDGETSFCNKKPLDQQKEQGKRGHYLGAITGNGQSSRSIERTQREDLHSPDPSPGFGRKGKKDIKAYEGTKFLVLNKSRKRHGKSVEEASLEEENTLDMYSPTESSRSKCPSTHIKEEPSSSGEDNAMDTSPEDTRDDFLYFHIKEESFSSEEDYYTDIYPNATQSEYRFKRESAPSERGDLSDTDVQACTEPTEEDYICFQIKNESSSCDEETLSDNKHIEHIFRKMNKKPGKRLCRKQKGHTMSSGKNGQDGSTSICARTYSCSVCQKCFNSNADLVKHQRIHTGEKPYSCSECGKCFSDKSNLLKHHKFHTRDGPFVCPECGKHFSYRSDLATHQRIHSGDKPFPCPECGKCFYQNSHLAEHQKIHRGVKPFSCAECGKCFTRSSHLAQHQMVHTGEKPFSCSECRKRFNDKSNLLKHQRLHARLPVLMARPRLRPDRRKDQMVPLHVDITSASKTGE